MLEKLKAVGHRVGDKIQLTTISDLPTIERGYSRTARFSGGRLVEYNESGMRLTAKDSGSEYPIPENISRLNSRDAVLKDLLCYFRDYTREKYDTDGYFHRSVDAMVEAVVGDGMRLRAMPRMQDGEVSRPRSVRLERAWKQWGEEKCDRRRELSFWEFEQLVVKSLLIDGEFLAIKHRYDNDSIFSLEVIDPELLDYTVKEHDTLNPYTYVSLGVERDRRTDRPQYYWISTDNASAEDSLWRGADRAGGQRGIHHIRYPARDVIHIYRRDYPQQSRGAPLMAAGSKSWYDSNRFFAAITRSVIARSAVIGAAEKDIYSNPAIDSENLRKIQTHGKAKAVEKTINEPHTIRNVRGKEGVGMVNVDGKVNWNNNTIGASEQLNNFVHQLLNGAISPSGVASFLATQDYEGISFSSAKAGFMGMKSSVKSLQQLVAAKFHSKVYEEWLLNSWSAAHSSSYYDIPIDTSFDNLVEHRFVGARLPQVQPEKEAAANELRLANGEVSRIDLIEEGGKDWRDVLEDEKMYLEARNQMFADMKVKTEVNRPNVIVTEEKPEANVVELKEVNSNG